MKPIIRFLKLTFVVEIFCEDGNWIAKSDSLGVVAKGESPEDAMNLLQREIQNAENQAARDRKAVEAGNAKKAKESKKESGKKAESTATDKDPEVDGDAEESLSEQILSGDIASLRELAKANGIESEGLTKVPLRELLMERLVNEDE